MNTKEILKRLGACEEALAWAEKHQLPEQAWIACVRPDWLIWVACAVGVDSSTMAQVACNLARSVIHLVEEGELRPLKAIEAAENCLANPCGKNRQAARAAGNAAGNAARAAGNAAARAAARAATQAAYAAAHQAAAYAAWAAVHAGEGGITDNAAQADIIRSSIAWVELEKLTLARICEA